MRTLTIVLFSFGLFGCASVNKLPQTRDEFVSGMKEGGLFRNSEQIAVKRPLKAVVADVREYASKCLEVEVSRRLKREAASSTSYRPKMTPEANGVVWLSVQELYNGKPSTGAPPGGLYSFAAELRAEGKNATRVDAYYLTGRGRMASWLKPWLEGKKDRCPAFD